MIDEIVDVIDKVDEVTRLLSAACALVYKDVSSSDEGLGAVISVAHDKVIEISRDLQTVADAIAA